MPSQVDHVSNARHNYAFLNDCISCFDVQGAFPDWLFIVRFYICVHIVEAILATTNQHSDKHSDRFTRVSRLKTLFRDDFEDHYRDLYNASYKARYSTKTMSTINSQRLADNNRSFEYIVEYAKKHFSITVD